MLRTINTCIRSCIRGPFVNSADPDNQGHMNFLSEMSHVMRKSVLPYANNKGADQPAHPHSLISTFVVRCLDTIIPLLSRFTI